MKAQNPSTAWEVLEALGGVDEAAALTGSNYKAVMNWKYFNAFPAYTYLAITNELNRRGKAAPLSLWKMRRRKMRKHANKAKQKKAA